jgi:hypothetical protein
LQDLATLAPVPAPCAAAVAMRRTTLGGLSASALNARPALGGRLGEPGKAALPPAAPRAERSAGDLGAPSGAFGARTSLRRTSVFSGSGSALRQARAHACAAGLRARPPRLTRVACRTRVRWRTRRLWRAARRR